MPTILWLGGFGSDMNGTKAQMLANWAQATGRDFLRFDYSGHGESSGRLEDGTIGAWRGDALTVLDQLTHGPVVLVGSSMGGWIACLVALARPERVAGMALIAPAPDFTKRLMKPHLSDRARAAIERDGIWLEPSAYGEGLPVTRALLEDGEQWSILDAPIPIHCPVRILQGGVDPDVPWRHALDLAEAIEGKDVVFTLIKDGDHRLSRDQDLARLVAVVEAMTV